MRLEHVVEQIKIDGQRLWGRIEALAAIGTTRLAFSEELLGHRFGLFGAGANVACGDSDTALGEQLLGLVFVEIQSN